MENETNTTNLSPAAQAVLDAFTEDNSLHDWKHNHYNTDALAAALRAAADEVAPMGYEGIWNDGRMLQYEKQDPVRDKILAIAAELEGSNG
jgi:hypothetical protein